MPTTKEMSLYMDDVQTWNQIISFYSANTWQSRNFTVYKGFSNFTKGQTLLYRNKASNGYRFSHYLDFPIVLQYLEINSSKKLTICELKLVAAGEYLLCLKLRNTCSWMLTVLPLSEILPSRHDILRAVWTIW